MLFSQDKNKKQNSEKKRSIFGLLFNPRIDRDIAPIKENASMFVTMLASLFATVGLFPKDHPALTGTPDKRLTMSNVIGTAYSNLQFTKEGIPQILYFAAVVGMLGFGALFMITLLLSFFTSTAHAQGIFEQPSTVAADWGEGWIDFLFMGEDLPGALGGGLGIDNSLQVALGTALQFYSTAVLTLAGLILLYHLTFMVAETAHSGQAMGQRANKIWAPIRLVLAIGLLVPVASSGGGVVGYNTGQYLGMQVAKWGSGLGSQVWSIFTDKVGDADFGCSSPTTPTSTTAVNPSCNKASKLATNLVKGQLLIAMCTKVLDAHMQEYDPNYKENYKVDAFTAPAVPNDNDKDKTYTFGLTRFRIMLGMYMGESNNYNACGSITYHPVSEKPFNKIDLALRGVFNSTISITNSFANANYKNVIVHGGSFQDIPGFEASLKTMIEQTQTNLELAFDSALSNADNETKKGLKDWLTDGQYKETGWMSAGAWFNYIMRASASRAAALNSMPTITSPDLQTVSDSKITSPKEQTSLEIQAFKTSLEYELKSISDKDSNFDAMNTDFNEERWYTWLNGYTNPFNVVAKLTNIAGGAFNLWNSETGELAINFGLKQNPLLELATLGQNFMNAASWLYGAGGAFVVIQSVSSAVGDSFWGSVASIATGSLSDVAKATIAATAGAVATACFAMGAIFILLGVSMAYIVPLYPFSRFFFATLTWVMTVFEAIVLIPLWALAHVNPFGEGISGDKAKYGYSVLMQLLLRPALMIFGLVAGYLIFSITIMFLNQMFLIATASTGNFEGSMQSIARLIYSVLYCIIVVFLANQCFSTIGLFPQQALAWLGMGGIKEEGFGSPSAAMAAVATYMSQNAARSMASIASVPGKAIAGRNQAHVDKAATATATATADYHKKSLEQREQSIQEQRIQTETQERIDRNTE